MAGEFLGGRTARRPDWAGRALAMAGGLLVAAAYPGPALLPPATGAWLVLPGVALLYLALARTRREREAFGCGWIAGAAHFALALHWMVHPFLVKADTHLWALPLAAVAVPAGFGLFWATAFAVARRMASRGPWLALAFALALSALEWVRGSALTGFPWAMPGQGWIHGETRSLYPAMGAYGAMFLTLLLPALAVSGRDGRRLAASLALTSAAAALVVVLCGFWADRATYPDAADGAARLRLVQPNIPQREKWARVHRLRNLSRLIALSESPGGGPPDVVIWPESALPTVLSRSELREGGRELLAQLLPPGAEAPVLLFGALTRDETGHFNSLVALDSAGGVDVYDKHHLVPFGEFLPFADLLQGVGIRAFAGSGFRRGAGPDGMQLRGLPRLAAAICYEAIFADEMRRAAAGADWLLQVTNDGWFGPGPGPQQHLALARIRAAELGLPLFRVANTGVTAVIDARGRIVRSLPLGEAGILDADLPPPRAEETYYRRWGERVFGGMWGLGALILLVARRRAGNRRSLP